MPSRDPIRLGLLIHEYGEDQETLLLAASDRRHRHYFAALLVRTSRIPQLEVQLPQRIHCDYVIDNKMHSRGLGTNGEWQERPRCCYSFLAFCNHLRGSTLLRRMGRKVGFVSSIVLGLPGVLSVASGQVALLQDKAQNLQSQVELFLISAITTG